jgi:aerobic-type carbon monoxide dehydrogenase small subunit (CoxS/CutS family)
VTDFLTSPLGFGAEDSPRTSYTLRVNGVERPVADAWIGESLLYVLRERLGLAGAKGGCEQGECGACSVQVDGQLTSACLVPAALAAGVEIRTVEGLADEGVPSDVQQALADSGAVQCGYCTPGLAMAVHDLLERNHHPSELEARQALCGNLCRCTGYRGALAAVQAVAAARADEEESPDEDVAQTPFFGDGPADGLLEATSPIEELVPAGEAAMPAQGEHGEGYDYEYDPRDGADQAGDDGYDVEAELPVYVDVPPQHVGYENYEGYETPGYGTQEPGYPQPGSYPQQGYATGTYDQPYEQSYGDDGPYPGGPFGGRFPSQSGGHASDATAGEGVGTLLMTEPTGTRQLPAVDMASPEFHPSADYATGEFHTGEFQTGEFHTGEYATGQFDTGRFATGPFATGEIPVAGEYAAEGYPPGYSGAEHAHQDHTAADYPAPTVPEQGGQAGQTGELRLGSGLGSGLGAGMRAQAAARRLKGDPATGATATAVTGTTAATPVSFGGAATSVSGLADVTGSFHVGTLSVSGGHGDATAAPTALPHDGATGVPGGLDPATGVYVLPHQHGQESGS